MHFADPRTLGGQPDHVGTTTVVLPTGSEVDVDVVVAAADAEAASERSVLALGEAKWRETITGHHVRRLEEARFALASQARDAKLLLFGFAFDADVLEAAKSRTDMETIDLERLYSGR